MKQQQERVVLTFEAYNTIKRTLPQDVSLKELERSPSGMMVYVSIDRAALDELERFRAHPSETISDIVMRLAELEKTRLQKERER